MAAAFPAISLTFEDLDANSFSPIGRNLAVYRNFIETVASIAAV